MLWIAAIVLFANGPVPSTTSPNIAPFAFAAANALLLYAAVYIFEGSGKSIIYYLLLISHNNIALQSYLSY